MVKEFKKFKLTLVKSPIGYHKYQRAVLRGLGLRRLHSTSELNNTAEIRGMINKVIHLVRYEGLS